MTPEISFKVAIFEQAVKKILHICLGEYFEKYSKHFFFFLTP